jgi:WD40 repeat protein
VGKKLIDTPKVLVQGHYSPCKKDNNEVWGLASFPKKDMYVTVSDDCTLRVWDAPSRKQIRLIKLFNDP